MQYHLYSHNSPVRKKKILFYRTNGDIKSLCKLLIIISEWSVRIWIKWSLTWKLELNHHSYYSIKHPSHPPSQRLPSQPASNQLTFGQPANQPTSNKLASEPTNYWAANQYLASQLTSQPAIQPASQATNQPRSIKYLSYGTSYHMALPRAYNS